MEKSEKADIDDARTDFGEGGAPVPPSEADKPTKPSAPVYPERPQKPVSMTVMQKMISYKKLQRVCAAFVIAAALGLIICVAGYLVCFTSLPDVSVFIKDWCVEEGNGYVGIHMNIINSHILTKIDDSLFPALVGAMPLAMIFAAIITVYCPVKKLNYKKTEKHAGALAVVFASVVLLVAALAFLFKPISSAYVKLQGMRDYYNSSVLVCWHKEAAKLYSAAEDGIYSVVIPQCFSTMLFCVVGIISGIALKRKKISPFALAEGDYASDKKGKVSTVYFKAQEEQYALSVKEYEETCEKLNADYAAACKNYKTECRKYKDACKNYKIRLEVYKAVGEKRSLFTGGALANWGIDMLTVFVSAITLGIAYPFMLCFKMKWQANHTYIDGRKMVFDGNGMQLWGKYLLWLLLSIITFGIYFVTCAKVNILKWKTKHTHFEGVGQGAEESAFSGKWYQLAGVNMLCNFVTLITLSFGQYWAHCYKLRWECKHKTVDGVKLVFDGTAMQYFAKRIVWVLLTIITFGVYGLWLKVKSEKWTVQHTHLQQTAQPAA